MNIFRTIAFRILALSLALPLLALWSGCSVDSTTSVPSDNDGTTYNFAGLYLHPDAATSTNGALAIVYPNQGSSRPSGQILTSLRLLQYGSVLEAFDSANLTWSGRINSIQGGSAGFTLEGRTTAGQAVTVAGTMTYADAAVHHECHVDRTHLFRHALRPGLRPPRHHQQPESRPHQRCLH